jgi:hypothetical protein
MKRARKEKKATHLELLVSNIVGRAIPLCWQGDAAKKGQGYVSFHEFPRPHDECQGKEVVQKFYTRQIKGTVRWCNPVWEGLIPLMREMVNVYDPVIDVKFDAIISMTRPRIFQPRRTDTWTVHYLGIAFPDYPERVIVFAPRSMTDFGEAVKNPGPNMAGFLKGILPHYRPGLNEDSVYMMPGESIIALQKPLWWMQQPFESVSFGLAMQQSFERLRHMKSFSPAVTMP